jgi:hypothetical protein
VCVCVCVCVRVVKVCEAVRRTPYDTLKTYMLVHTCVCVCA